MGQLEPAQLQEPPQNVLEHERPEIPNVRVVVDRRAARVHAHFPGLQRIKRFNFSRIGIVDLDLVHGPSVVPFHSPANERLYPTPNTAAMRRLCRGTGLLRPCPQGQPFPEGAPSFALSAKGRFIPSTAAATDQLTIRPAAKYIPHVLESPIPRRNWPMRHPLALALICASLVISHSAAQETPASSTATTASKKTLTPDSFLDLRTFQDPQFSPDGSRIVFAVSDPLKREKRTTHLWLYDLSAASTRQLTFSLKSESFPRWSPDGKTIPFLSNRGGDQQQIYLLRMEGGEATPTTKPKASVSALAWSPDGKSIGYLSPEPKSDAEEKKQKLKNDT